MFFKRRSKPILGIDIGTSSIKVVQLRKKEDKFELETYGELFSIGYLERADESFQTTSFRKTETVTRELLRILLKESEVDTKQAVMSIPIFSSFVSVIEMPEMGEKELARAVQFEARRYVPIPLVEVALDWKIIESGMIKDENSSKTFRGKRIILIAVPKEVVSKYIRIAEILGLRILALELESFSLGRSLMMGDVSSACVLDVGARATSFTIVDKGAVQMSHSLDIAGAEITKTLASGLKIASKRAEELKITYGLNHKEEKEKRREMQELLNVPVDKIINEIERMINSYQSGTKRKIEKLILNGGSAQLAGLEKYIEEKINIKTIVANPWSRIIYPSSLEQRLKEIGPQFSVAIGAAMREN